ncbi:MAG: hypothetical protein ACE5GU_01965 [Candidatus Scalinduaceae bacterium]
MAFAKTGYGNQDKRTKPTKQKEDFPMAVPDHTDSPRHNNLTALDLLVFVCCAKLVLKQDLI